MTRAVVLVIVEAGADLSTVCTALQQGGCDVLVAESGSEASDLLGSRAVECVVLGSVSTLGGLRERLGASRVPCLLTVAAGDEALVAGALDAGADDSAPLTEDLGVLMARVRALLRRKRGEDERVAALTETVARKDAELVSLNYAISHDLRAPLRAIDGFGRILIEECASSLDAKHVDYLQRIGAAARELGVLIDDLLQLSRVGRVELRKGRLDLTELARRVVADLQARSNRAVEVIVEENLVVHGDRTLMRIALEHLIGNSWKFTARSHAPRVECRAERAADGSAIVVRDNGVGFDATRAHKLFRPFQRLHTAAEFEGAGIGLAVVHKIMDRHGGRVWAESRPGEGAAFYFALPRASNGDLR